MKFHQMSKKELIEKVQTDLANGLSQSEANARLEKDGKNELEKPKKRLLILRFFDQLKDFMIAILLGASVLSFVTGDYAEGALVIAIILIMAILGLAQEAKAEKALEAIQKMSTPHATVRRDGVEMVIDVSELVVGDIVLINAGDYIPADIRIIESVNLKVDESALTGESISVLKISDLLNSEDLTIGDRVNMGYMSTVATYGRGVGVVVKTGMDTEIGKIAEMISIAKNDQTPLQKSINKLGKTLAIIAIAITAVIFAINLITHYSLDATPVGWEVWKNSLMTSVALAVAAIPEGLPAIITITLALGMQSLARQKAIMKTLPAVETLGSTSIICSDKTGTLTQNIMTVTTVYYDDKIVKVNSKYLLEPKFQSIINYAVLCNDSKFQYNNDEFIKIGDPTELALIDLAINSNLNPVQIIEKYPRLYELPFDSKRKLMTTVHKVDGEIISITKGAPDVMFSRACNTKNDIIKLEKNNDLMTDEALRVLAIGFKKLDDFNLDEIDDDALERDLNILGLVGMVDPPRPEVKDAILTSYHAGIDVIMITGDHKNTAMAIAKELNIIKSDQDFAISGVELDKLSDDEFREKLEHIKVYARVSPENKVRIVNAWKNHGNIVAMTGDGVNDAPALKSANIGIAMGITGTEVSKGAADMVLADDNFTTIVNAVGEGRGIYANIRKAIHFLLSCNTGEILTILLGTILGAIIFGIPVTTLTAVQILWVNLVTDSLMAIAIGMEPREENIMNEQPRDTSKSFFSDGLGIKIAWQGSMLGVLSFSAFIIGYFIHEGTSADKLLNASTMTFMVLAISQLFHALNAKSETESIFKTKFNKYLLGAFIISLTLQLLTIVFGFTRNIFDLSSLNVIEWLIVVALAITPVVVVEIQKLITRIIKKKRAI